MTTTMIKDTLKTFQDAAAYKTKSALVKSPALTSSAFVFSLFFFGMMTRSYYDIYYRIFFY